VGLAAFSNDFESAVFFVRQKVAFQFYLIEKHKKNLFCITLFGYFARFFE